MCHTDGIAFFHIQSPSFSVAFLRIDVNIWCCEERQGSISHLNHVTVPVVAGAL